MTEPIRLAFPGPSGQPREHQRAAHALRLAVRFIVLVWHRRAGKTVFALMELILGALACEKPLGRYAYIAPLLKQAKKGVWDLLKLFTRPIPGVVYNESELTVTFENGAKISLFGADNPDSLRSLYFDGAVLDEVAQMPRAIWGEVVRPLLEDRMGWAIFIGTPHGENLFEELYTQARRGRDGWAADLRRGSETGVFAPEQLADLRRDMSPPEYAQEIECDFAAAVANALLPLDLVLAAQERTLHETAYNEEPRLLGIDVARDGGDRSVIFPRQGLMAFKPSVHRFSGATALMDFADLIAEVATRWTADHIFIDIGGMGNGVHDRLAQLGYNTHRVDFGARAMRPDLYENRRAEIWWKMAEWVKAGGCLPQGEDIRKDLTKLEYDYRNKRDRMQLETKAHLEKRGIPSPDIGDALATTFWAPVAALSPEQRQLRKLGRSYRGGTIRREDDLQREA